MKDLCSTIRAAVGDRSIRLCGRGSTALWVALRCIGENEGEGGEVILPDMTCHSVLETVLAAGFQPRFAAVGPSDYCISPASVSALITARTKAVVVTHLFGHPASIADISGLCARHNIRVIEDAAHGIGGRLPNGGKIGASGDFAFVSFHPSKMIQGFGGALLFDDPAWKPAVDRILRSLPPAPGDAEDYLLSTSLRDLYHGLGQAIRLHPEVGVAKAFSSMIPVFRPLLLTHFDSDAENLDTVIRSWEGLPAQVDQRLRSARLLAEVLGEFPVYLPPLRDGDAIWRYSIRFPDVSSANSFIVGLRRAAGPVSHIYYPLSRLFDPATTTESKADELFRTIVNLWVADTPDEYVQTVAKVARGVFGGGNDAARD